MMRPPTQKKQLEFLRNQCKYSVKGKPDIYTFGALKDGLTGAEVKDYLRIRTNRMNITKILRKYNTVSGANTCAVILVNGRPTTLYYRCDVDRFTEQAIENTPTYFD